MNTALDVLRRQAEANEQRALTTMARSREAMAQERARLDELHAYPDAAHTGGNHRWTLLNRHAFDQRLQQAIRLQRRQLEKCETEVAQARAQWEAAHHATQQLSQLIEKRRQDAERVVEKRVQREIDDRSVQRAARALRELAF